MENATVHQLLHGYRSGHGQISSSIRLNARNSELVTRLSDLSGSLSTGTKFSSYVTFYPLPTRDYYALAKTWPDPNAPRSGCVVTHTLLVSTEEWSLSKNVNCFRSLFKNPLLNPDHDFTKPLFASADIDDDSQAFRLDQKSASQFISRYFGGAIRPLVWFGTTNTEEYAWRLVQHLWPKLRGVFSCCSYSLRQRTLEDRPFDLLFAPDSVYSRFTKMSIEHLILPRAIRSEESDNEAWIQYWTKAMFSPQPGLPAGEEELSVWHELDDDPTAIRKLSLIQDLRSRSNESPTAGVGAIDVVESLARNPMSALNLKREVLHDAISASRISTSVEEAAMCLRLIDDRLHRDAFSAVSAEYSNAISTASMDLTIRTPGTVLATYKHSLGECLSDDQSAFGKGVFLGLVHVATVEPYRLDILGNFPLIAADVFRAAPAFGTTYYRSGGESAVRTLASWFLTTNDKEARTSIRKNLLSEPDIYQHCGLLTEMFSGVNEGEISGILDTIAENGIGLGDPNIRKALGHSDNSKIKRAIRRWVGSQGFAVPHAVELAAETFAQNADGFTSLIKSEEVGHSLKANMLAAYFENLGSSKPYWVSDKLSADRIVLQELLQFALEDGRVESLVNPFVYDLTALPVTTSPELLHIVMEFKDRATSGHLTYLALKDALQSQFQGAGASHIESFLQADMVGSWMEQAHSRDVVALVVQSCHRDPFAVSRAWKWVARAPDALYYKQSTLLDITDSLLSIIRQILPAGTVESLLACVSRTKNSNFAELHYEFCSRILRFSFENSRHSLGALIPATFPDVYAGVVKYERKPSFFFGFFNSYDWDKGKELRSTLVDTFLGSQWPAVYLAIAANRANILNKVFKRIIRRSNGSSYLNTMLAELRDSADEELMDTATQMEWMLEKPDFYEEWD